MYSYHVYGLSIESEIELPELLPDDNTADVRFRLGEIKHKPIIADGDLFANWAAPTEACISYKEMATFLIRNGNEVIIEPDEKATPTEINHLLLGTALSVILYQRGFLVLHCSLVEMNGYAVGFIGHSGNGKSSLATAMYEHGHKLISDDLAVIDQIDGQYVVYSGFPQLKLWPDLIESIGINPDNLPRITDHFTKRTRRLNERFVDVRYVPIQQFYILNKGDNIDITPIKGHQSVIEFVGFSYDIELIKAINQLGNHFLQCSQLAQQINIKQLTRPWSLDRMPDVIQAIEDDMHLNKRT